MIKVGVLALQGAVAEHINCLNRLPGVCGIPVKTLAEISTVAGLIIPGGESTAMGKILNYFKLLEPLQEKIAQGLPVWGTCAGMILLAKQIVGQTNCYLANMDITVQRNAYGNQLASFQTTIELVNLSDKPISLIFIRAPYIVRAGADVKILATVDGKIVAAQQKNMFTTAFHPELTTDLSCHSYFVNKFIK